MIARRYADTSSGQVHYRTVDGPGLPIVLLYRTPVCSSSFERVLAFLDGKARAIALDTPGFGQTFRPTGHPSTPDYARWLLQATDAIGLERFHLAAHHTGTHFAVEMAVLSPDRVASLTLSGVLYASAEDRAKSRAEIGNASEIDSNGDYISKTWKLMNSLFLDYDGELVHAETMGALVSADGRNQAFDAIFAQDFGAVFRQVRCPVQVVQASDDPLTLGGMLTRFREDFPKVPVITAGAAFLATPERQSGAFARALLSFTQHQDTAMKNHRYELLSREGGYDLHRADQTIPEPGHGEVLLRVRAVSLNRRDIGIRDLSYPVNGADHFTPLSDAAGEVVAVGPDVHGWKPGDRVCATFFQNWQGGRPNLPAALSALGNGGPGVFCDYAVLSADGLVALPSVWSFEEGATLGCAGVTAWNALFTAGKLQKGDWVLVIGTGGVAVFALQLAVAAGARVIVLSSSAEKLARAKALGAEAGINYREIPDWADTVRKLTGGAGVHHVVELGGDGTLEKSIACLGIGGHLALIGALDGFGGQFSALPLIFAALRISAIMVGPRDDHAALTEFMLAHDLRPVIDSTFAFDDAEAAYLRASAGAFGKVVIRMDS